MCLGGSFGTSFISSCAGYPTKTDLIQGAKMVSGNKKGRKRSDELKRTEREREKGRGIKS